MDDCDTILIAAKMRLDNALRDDDAVQSVLISLWQALQRGTVDVPKYLSTAIRNQKCRQMRRNYSASVELTDDIVPAHEEGMPVRDYSRFNDEQRQIIELLEEGNSAADIASLLRVHRATLYRRLESMRQIVTLQTQSI